MIDVTDQNFAKEVLQSERPVFACFTGRQCLHCIPVCLIADDLMDRYGERVKFVRIDVQASREMSKAYDVTAVPSIILFHNARMIKKLIGYQEKSALMEMLDALLK